MKKKVRKINKRSNFKTKKYTKGEAIRFITRAQALRKLQLSLRSFRRLCILKGIYPVVPNNPTQANKGNSAPTTFYLLKDIQFLAREPLLDKFHQQRIFLKRIRKAVGRGEKRKARDLDAKFPSYRLDHLVVERYPKWELALADMDDALCTIFLFAAFPANKTIAPALIHMCQRLVAEFFNYVIYSQSLEKAFISIKGYYYQADICGQKVVWLQPHAFKQTVPRLVDVRVMRTFLDFYVYLIGFINYRLFQGINLVYPPKLVKSDCELEEDYLIAFNYELSKKCSVDEELAELDDFGEDADKKENSEVSSSKKEFKNLFKGLKFYISREVPREQFAFVIRAFGGQVSWSESQGMGASFKENDPSVTHQIVDRKTPADSMVLGRYYIQPQWVFDCVNAGKLLPTEPYLPGKVLPPHKSPFVEGQTNDIRVGSASIGKVNLLPRQENEANEDEVDMGSSSSESEDEKEPASKAPKLTPKANDTEEVPEVDKQLLANQLPKKHRWLYNHIERSNKIKKEKEDKLKMKRKITKNVMKDRKEQGKVK